MTPSQGFKAGPDQDPSVFALFAALFAPSVALLGVLGSLSAPPAAEAAELEQTAQTQTVPLVSHVLVVVMENKSYDQVRFLPYTASLIAANSSFASFYAITHPSQPNYIAIWAGSTLGVDDDACPPTGSPFNAQNLGHACETAGISWRSYAENLPSPGYDGCYAGGDLYVRRHCPWTYFTNLDHQSERPYTDLAHDIADNTLPRLAFVIPNQCNNTHDCSPIVGDNWLASRLPAMIDAVGPNGVVILTWDEDDDSDANHILTVFIGPLVKPGFVSNRVVTHYTLLRTICDALGIPPFALAAGQAPITDVWLPPSSVAESAPPLMLSDLIPNPTRAGFEARLFLPAGAMAAASIFDASGRELRSLPIGERGSLVWDGRGGDERLVGAGAYFLRVRLGREQVTRKLLVVR